jgi:hypothetical protein
MKGLSDEKRRVKGAGEEHRRQRRQWDILRRAYKPWEGWEGERRDVNAVTISGERMFEFVARDVLNIALRRLGCDCAYTIDRSRNV